jgi:hypothetical protein
MKTRRTQEHAQFFALMEKPKPIAKSKPKGIKDMGWVNGCWQAIAVNHQKDTVAVSTPRHTTFGVSVADAIANANMEVLP